MGKCRVRTKGKGKRWVKGHSCVSNPQSKKHRDVAKTRFFQENLGQTPAASSLTYDAVRKHEIFLSGKQNPIESDRIEGDEETASAGGDTFKTFASDWTNCSNVSFNRLLNGFQPNNAQHKEMLAVLAAVTEVIKSQGGSETANEYFGALLTALTASQSEESTTAIVSLLAMAIKQVPPSVLRATGDEVSQTLLRVLLAYVSVGNTAVLRGTIGCLSVVIRVQDISAWNTYNWIKNAFNNLLPFIIFSKPKVRKCAQHAIGVILKKKPVDSVHPAAEFLGDSCVAILDQPSGDITTTVLHMFGFLKGVMYSFPKTQLQMCCEKILSIISLGEPTILLCGLQALHGVMVMHPPISALPPKLNARLINALYDFRPGTSDIETTMVWLSLMQEAFSNLAKNDQELCLANVPRFTKCIAEIFLCDDAELMRGAAFCLKDVIENSLGEEVGTSEDISNVLRQVMECLYACLKFQYFHAWKYVVHVLGAIYTVAGKQFPNLMIHTLQVIGSLRDTDKALAGSVDNAVGCAVSRMGPRVVLQSIPLQLDIRLAALENGSDMPFDFPRSWLLPVLKEKIYESDLGYFIQFIYPLATTCKRLRDKLSAQKESGVSHSLDLIYCQLWSLFPCFCSNPSDLKENFKSIAKLLGMLLRDNKELRLDVMGGLRRLVLYSVATPRHADARAEMSRYAKNYLPILLNIYTNISETVNIEEHGNRLAALETIKVYLEVASQDMCSNLFDLTFNKLTASIGTKTGKKKQDEKVTDAIITSRHALLQLMGALLPYIDMERLVKLFYYIPLLLTTADHKTQKRGYRLLQEMFLNNSKVCAAFLESNASAILSLLINTQASAKPPSRTARLRCLSVLIPYLELCDQEQLQLLLPEAIICCRDINANCRSTAFLVLLKIASGIQRWTGKEASDVIRDLLVLILPGLQGSVHLISATVIALASLINDYGKLIPEDVLDLLLYNVCALVVSNVREVAGACLSFLKGFLSIYKANRCEPYLPQLVQSLVNMNEDCKQHFRLVCRDLLVRLVRRYGIQVVTSLVPENDEIMHKRLKNIRKEFDRKARNRELARQQHESDDENMKVEFDVKPQSKSIEEILAESEDEDYDSSDFEDVDDSKTSRKPAFKQAKAWIQEGEDSPVDFRDSTAGKKIRATDPRREARPGPSKKTEDRNRGFKTAPDGRLIITEASDSEDEGDQRGKRKREIAVDSDEEMDAEDAEDFNESRGGHFVLAPGSKRRRALSLSSVDALTEPPMKYQAGGSGIHRSVHTPKSAHTGEEYLAKKAKGDVKKKGKVDPYAYVPLDSKLLNRRKRAKHAGNLKQLEVSAKKGALKGSKARAKVLGKRRK